MRVSEFLSYFYPDETETIYGRVVLPRGFDGYPRAAHLSFSRQELVTDPDLQDKLRQWNQTHGMYFTVNAGGVTDDEITRINAVFCEIDDRPIQEQLDIYENCPLTPSLLVQTKKSIHAYWLLNEVVTVKEFRTLQKGLIQHFESDGKVCNPSRVMRLPGFAHLSESGRVPVTVQASPGHRYSYAEIFNEFPFEWPQPKQYPKLSVGQSDGNDELRRRIQSSEWYHEEREYGYTRGLCHNGQGNNGVFVHLPTGAVKCFKQCTWWQVCEGFGVYAK